MNNKFIDFRKKYSNFYYRSYKYKIKNDSLEISYHFEIENLESFHPTWNFPIKFNHIELDDNLDNLIFSLGMVELISYWKLTCSKNVIIDFDIPSDIDIDWWKKLYFNGLGEFFYVNNIEDVTVNNFMNIYMNGKSRDIEISNVENYNNYSCLIPIGGGKDSAVTLELLKSNFEQNTCYMINPNPASLDCANAAGYPEEKIYIAERTLDKNMLRMNKEGYLNGHTPFSAIVAFSSSIAAKLNKIKYIVLSNESSANESTVLDTNINHQYSKTFEFENDFHEYAKKYLNANSYYFSLLRPISELQIAKLFANKCEKYFDIFRSCNVGSKKNKWCGKCAKCLFVYLILSPYLSHEKMLKIFGKDMANDPDLVEIFSSLTGISEVKPFECVGSVAEVNVAVSKSIKQINKKQGQLPCLYNFYIEYGHMVSENDSLLHKYDNYYDKNNLLPEYFDVLLRKGLNEVK